MEVSLGHLDNRNSNTIVNEVMKRYPLEHDGGSALSYQTNNRPEIGNPVAPDIAGGRETTNMRKNVWLLFGWLLLATPAAVHAQFTFITNNDTITITGYTGPGGDVTIPSTINGLPVTSIGEDAFFDCGLTSITIPESATNIGYGALSWCRSLTNIIVEPPNLAYSTEDGVLFDTGQTTLVQYPCGRPGSYSIPNGVTSIGNTAFGGCALLSSIVIANSVTTISDWAFAGCTQLTSITIPSSVITIGDYAFPGCTGLTNVTFGNAVSYIGDWAFNSCSNLTSVIIPSSVVYLGDDVFFGSGLTNVTILGDSTAWSSASFAGCGDLTTITIGSDVTNVNIGNAGFASDPIQTITVDVGNPFYSSVDGVLFDTSQTTLILYPLGRTGSYTIPSGVVTIGTNAFDSCGGLTSVTIPNSVTSIGDYAFNGCSSLMNAIMGSGVTNIGYQAFSQCTNLMAIDVSVDNNSFLSVDGVLFDRSQTTLIQFPAGSGATSYSIPNGVTSMGDYAFNGCTSLISVTIPDSVTSIGDFAFEYCTSLLNVAVGTGVTNLGTGTFFMCANLGGILFEGNSPSTSGPINQPLQTPGIPWPWPYYGPAYNPIVYYLPGATGWSSSFGGCQALLWNPVVQAAGVQSNLFGFDISGTMNIPVAVEATSSLAGGNWVPLQMGMLTNGLLHFNDSDWATYPARFYRLGFWPGPPPAWNPGCQDCVGP